MEESIYLRIEEILRRHRQQGINFSDRVRGLVYKPKWTDAETLSVSDLCKEQTALKDYCSRIDDNILDVIHSWSQLRMTIGNRIDHIRKEIGQLDPSNPHGGVF